MLNKAAYTVLGITLSGNKDTLGIWIGEAESSSFWLGVCNDLKTEVEWVLGTHQCRVPRTSIQLCVIHQIRNSVKYVPHRKPIMVDLKKVYQALTLLEAEFAFEELSDCY